ncbi:Tubulin-folding cofactor E [Aphelenchoides fujianensis]|nr:Tubulin-folding cofactor E [Aphelenchoides fujianensis]
MNTGIRLEQRVAVGDRRGAVKFVGRVEGSEEECWIGVDWDNPTDGKHDGTVKGRRYFHAKSPTSGSFVKPKDVIVGPGLQRHPLRPLLRRRRSECEWGRRVRAEGRGRWIGVSSALFFRLHSTPSSVLQRTFTMDLDNQFVSHLEPDFDVRFPKCVSLSLVNNLLCPIGINCSPSSDCSRSSKFSTFRPTSFFRFRTRCSTGRRTDLSELVMNNCGVKVEELRKIGRLFPQLTTLVLLDNNLEHVEFGQEFDQLKSLNLSKNPIGAFEKLWPLGRCPSDLETLNLRSCGIKKIALPPGDSFQRLEMLGMAENPVNDWESINELGRLPRLKNFRSSGLHAGERGCQSYEMIVAKLPHAQVVDGELLFLHRFFQPPLLPVHQADVERLARVYGPPEAVESGQQRADNLCSFVLVYKQNFAARPLGFRSSDVRVVIQVLEHHYETFEWNSSILLRALDPPPDCRVDRLPGPVCRSGPRRLTTTAFKIRHIVAVSFRILHPEKPPLPLGELETELRQSLAKLEQVALRLLGFDLEVRSPHNYAYMIAASLRDYFPNELADVDKLTTTIGTLLQDACVDPDFFVYHSPLTGAIVLISLALQLLELPIKDERWTPIFNRDLSSHRLQKLKRRFLRKVYEEDC